MNQCARVPFAERGGKIRGFLDLATGRYPLFLFGGPIGSLLPVFHFHDVSRGFLAPRLQYLAENGYRAVSSDAIIRLVRDGIHPGPFTVALCFDDARESLWTVAAPLLREYGFQAIAFAIPGRMADAPSRRPALNGGTPGAAGGHDPQSRFVTWAEIRELHASGIVDVQSHTHSHSSIYCADRLVGFVTPTFARLDPLDRPLVSRQGAAKHLSPEDLGAPLYLQRSRMSDALRFFDDEKARERCQERVREGGGVEFFTRPAWRAELRALAAPQQTTYESEAERHRSIIGELHQARTELESRLRTPTRCLCFPWGVGGSIAREAAARAGYAAAFSERLFGLRAVRAGDDPYRLMRLNGKWITRLPRRRRLFSTRAASAGHTNPAARYDS